MVLEFIVELELELLWRLRVVKSSRSIGMLVDKLPIHLLVSGFTELCLRLCLVLVQVLQLTELILWTKLPQMRLPIQESRARLDIDDVLIDHLARPVGVYHIRLIQMRVLLLRHLEWIVCLTLGRLVVGPVVGGE